jgi:UTP--glucose-1-phosphate uridylyltransferase
VIPAAGLGTRMLPATKAIPKEMLPVAGKPLVQYAVEEAAASGIETVILVIRDPKSLIRAHFAQNDALESYLDERGLRVCANLVRDLPKIAELRFVQQSKPLGLAHAVSCARSLLGNDPFVVLLPDVIMVSHEPVIRQLVRAHEETGGSVVALREVESRDVRRFGIVQVERGAVGQSKRPLRITGLVEKPTIDHAPSRLGVFGRYLLEPSIWNAIVQTSPDASGEVQLTDALNLLCQDQPLFGFRFEGRHHDAGNPLGYLKANLEIALQDPRLCEPLLRYVSDLQAQTGVSIGSSSSSLHDSTSRR